MELFHAKNLEDERVRGLFAETDMDTRRREQLNFMRHAFARKGADAARRVFSAHADMISPEGSGRSTSTPSPNTSKRRSRNST